MTNFFGSSDAIITLYTFAFGAVAVLMALIFRKSVANDTLNMPFSVIGSSAGSILAFIIIDNIFHLIKWSALAGIIAWISLGFICSEIFGDGEASG